MQTVLVTGGTGGIGGEIVKFLLKNEYSVWVWGREEEKFAKLISSIEKKYSSNLHWNKVDVSKEEEVKDAIARLSELDVLVNAAAVLWPLGVTGEVDLEKFKKAFAINFFGTLNCCYYALPLIKKSKKGKIINFSGGGSAYGRENHAAYGCSKTAVVRLTENLAMEYPDIDINAIAPGVHKTPMWKDEIFDTEPEKWADINEFLKFFDFLVSDESRGISGKFLHFKDSRENLLDEIKSNPDLYTLRRIDNLKFLNK